MEHSQSSPRSRLLFFAIDSLQSAGRLLPKDRRLAAESVRLRARAQPHSFRETGRGHLRFCPYELVWRVPCTDGLFVWRRSFRGCAIGLPVYFARLRRRERGTAISTATPRVCARACVQLGPRASAHLYAAERVPPTACFLGTEAGSQWLELVRGSLAGAHLRLPSADARLLAGFVAFAGVSLSVRPHMRRLSLSIPTH